MSNPSPRDCVRLSVVIPARNEEAGLGETLRAIYGQLTESGIDHEILVVDDHSTDRTPQVLEEARRTIPSLVYHSNPGLGGFGRAVRYGLEKFRGDCVAIMMADQSDSPEDLVKFYRKMQEGHDCVFGSRFVKGGSVTNYPPVKLIANRIANHLTRIVFRFQYNDVTNAFKMYRRETIEGLKPLLAPHFNLTLELPLKAIVRGYSYAVVPNAWTHRRHGASKLKIKEMGSRYFFIFLYCLIEKYFSKGDYNKCHFERSEKSHDTSF